MKERERERERERGGGETWKGCWWNNMLLFANLCLRGKIETYSFLKKSNNSIRAEVPVVSQADYFALYRLETS